MTTFSNTQALIAVSEVETGLMNLALAEKAGKRVVTQDRYNFDDQLGELAEKFWRIYFDDRYDAEANVVLHRVCLEVHAMGASLDSTHEWEFNREQQEYFWRNRHGYADGECYDSHPADWCLESE
jgi:hypothetical protein